MAATNTEGVKLISITTSDGVNMQVERPVAERSILIKNLLEDLGGEELLAERVFADPGVQKAVLDFFDEVVRGGDEEDWETQVEGPEVPSAGTMVDDELLKAAGLMEGDIRIDM